MLEAGLTALLLADPTIQSLCAHRIYPVILPDEATLPAISYQGISERADYSLSGERLLVTRIQFDAFARTYGDAKQLAAAVQNVLEGFRGMLPDGTSVQVITRDGYHDMYEDVRLWRVSFDLKITHNS